MRDLSDGEAVKPARTVVIDADYVASRLTELLKDKDVSGYLVGEPLGAPIFLWGRSHDSPGVS